MTISRFLHKLRMAPKWLYYRFYSWGRWWLMKVQKNGVWNPINHKIRPWIWKMAGVDVPKGGSFMVGYDVYFDAGYAEKIHIEEGVWIASRSLFLCHKRILDDYCIGDDYNQLKYKTGDIYLKKGCCIGMGSIIMPGVTIGEGSIIGAGSLVVKDIPPYCIAVGNPCKIVKYLPKRESL